MKVNEIRKMTSSDLEKELGELKSELYKIRDKLQDAKILIFGSNGFIFT